MNLSQYKLSSIPELLEIFHQDPERFMKFYNSVFILLYDIPPGGSLNVVDHCKEKSYGLFVKCACYCIMEELSFRNGATDAMLIFNDTYTVIYRGREFIPAKTYKHYYSTKQAGITGG